MGQFELRAGLARATCRLRKATAPARDVSGMTGRA
jgi:hypothetical protein